MLYFAYGHDLNHRSLVEWCDLTGRKAPRPRRMKPAVAINQRLAFPTYSSYWQGGVAGIIPEPGKRVSGALIELPAGQVDMLGEFNGRTVDGIGRERGTFKLADVTIEPYGGHDRVQAVTFIPARPEEGHVPPTRLYVDRMIEAALDLDLSAMWMMLLRSCVTGPEESSHFFPGSGSGQISETAGDIAGPVRPSVSSRFNRAADHDARTRLRGLTGRRDRVGAGSPG